MFMRFLLQSEVSDRKNIDLKSNFKSNGRVLNRKFSALALPLYFAISTLSFADSVTYFGVELPVDSTVAVQDGNTKVTVDGKSILVPQGDVPKKVASIYAADSELLQKNLKWEAVSTLLSEVLSKDEELAVQLLQSIFKTSNYLSEFVGQKLSAIGTNPATAPTLERALSSFDAQLPNPAVLCEAFAAVRETSRRLLQERSPKLVYRYQYQCTEYLQKRSQQLLTEGDLTNGIRIMGTISQLFADGGEAYLPLVTARNRLLQLESAIASGDYLSVSRHVKGLGEDPWLAPFSINLSRSVVQLTLESAIKDSKFGNALRLVPAIDYQRRTPRDHQLILNILEGITASEKDALLADSVSVSLGAFARKDPAIAKAYTSALERVVNEILTARNFQGVEPVLQRLFAVRPDPAPANDVVRGKVVEALLAAGMVFEARSVAAEMTSSVSPVLQLRLLLAGAYVEVGVLIGLIAATFLAVVFLVWGRRSRRPKPVAPKAKPQPKKGLEAEEEDEPPQPRRFVVYSHGIKVGQGLDEYSECLKVFSLKPGVSLQKIKVAYRNAVKTCHPDLNPNAGEAEAARFIQLTRTYEKLLELHEQRTGER
jgi:hypothetical protein